ncbi:DUF4097 family beta strand repeat-containing protein [Siminovitchia sp. FSL W7-1587]|uniref:DUF4097 family beta strand repeat-containing protein n=1 Tax=Siminovitchia sp. FSL W7-1587 TaxID=2954699 RepID=UPI0030CBA7A4
MVKSLLFPIIIMLFMISGCTNTEKDTQIQKAPIDEIDQIYIDFGSTDMKFFSSDAQELEARITLYDQGPGVTLDQTGNKLFVDVERDMTRLFKIGKKPKFEVYIPNDYKGLVILDGSSGNVSGEKLQLHDLEIKASSGNVQLDFLQFHSDVNIVTTSGNIEVNFDDQNPDLDLDLKTNSGRQSVDISLNKHEQTKKGLVGISGNGKYKMNLETASGNITLQ